jgi:hypothetical protein
MNTLINFEEVGMFKSEIDLLISYLDLNDIFFEWGSGGSTFNFSKLVKEYYSVENDLTWYDKVTNELKNRSILNTTVFYKPIHEIKFDNNLDKESYNLLKFSRFEVKDNIFYSKCRGIPVDWHCFTDYINSIEIPNKKFSKIFVDGRARVFCAYKALNYLNDDGILFVHDWSRKSYHSILDYYTKIDEINSTVTKLAVFKKI